jgi:hypothetical protein
LQQQQQALGQQQQQQQQQQSPPLQPHPHPRQLPKTGLSWAQRVQLVAFCVFEVVIGLFWPSMMTLRAAYVPEEERATIINIFRIPLNLFVCVILWKVRERVWERGAGLFRGSVSCSQTQGRLWGRGGTMTVGLQAAPPALVHAALATLMCIRLPCQLPVSTCWCCALLLAAGQRVPAGVHPGAVQRVPGGCSRLHGPPGALDPQQGHAGQAQLARGGWGR